MSLTGSLFTVGAAEAVTIVPPSVDSQKVVVRNSMPSGSLGEQVREGYAYAVHADLEIVNNGVAYFSFTTGDFGAQILGYKIASQTDAIEGDLIEGATITKGATPYPAYNLNRDHSDAYEAEIYSATNIVGGTIISSESVFASNQAAGGMDTSKIITLSPNTEYGFRFTNVGSQTTNVHFEMIWTERFNGQTTVWLNGTEGNGYRLKPGDAIEMQLFQGESMTAISGGADCSVTVLRQD